MAATQVGETSNRECGGCHARHQRLSSVDRQVTRGCSLPACGAAGLRIYIQAALKVAIFKKQFTGSSQHVAHQSPTAGTSPTGARHARPWVRSSLLVVRDTGRRNPCTA